MTQRAHEGELFMDHRASPGLPEEWVRKYMPRLDPRLVGEGTVFEAPTMGCAHCQTVVIMNPDRKRSRAYCFQCNRYICDTCDAARHHPDYVHKPFASVVEDILRGHANG